MSCLNTERVLAHNSMSAQFSELFARLESYPRLVSNDLFRKFYDRITELENKISLQREFFNDAVTLHNDIRAKFPSILFAKLFGFPYQAVLTKSYIRDNID